MDINRVEEEAKRIRTVGGVKRQINGRSRLKYVKEAKERKLVTMGRTLRKNGDSNARSSARKK